MGISRNTIDNNLFAIKWAFLRMSQNVHLIDISSWQVDIEHEIFPVGARDKLMVWSPIVEPNGLKPSWPYLFKESITSYPDQFWAEIIAYIVSQSLGVNVPKAMPAIRVIDNTTTHGVLMEWFYDRSSQGFIHASQYFQRLIENFDNHRGTQHNINDFEIICRFLSQKHQLTTPYMSWLAEMALFDALIGNTDRHQENWGVIFNSDDTCELSPFFDNGTSLGHERFPFKVKSWSDDRLEQYLRKGMHHFRYHRTAPERIQLFDLVEYLAETESLRGLMRLKLQQLDMEKVISKIEELKEINIQQGFTIDRYLWVMRVLVRRYEILSNILEC